VTLAAASTAAPIADALLRACIDLATISVLAGVLFLRRHRRQDLLAVYFAFNVGLFGILTFLSDSQVSVGVGFGIFGVLSIIRLRSEAYNNTEIAYFFLSLATALVNALPGRPLAMSITLDVAIVLTMYFVDSPSLVAQLQSCEVVLDRVYEDEAGLRADLERRLHASLEQVTVHNVDYVRETTTVSVRYRPGLLVKLPTP
jgi:hypothetical protein